MIVDSSALIALIKGEPEADSFAQAMQVATSTVWLRRQLVCTFVVRSAYRNPKLGHVRRMLEHPIIVIEPVTAEQARIARQAYRDYGRGSGHAANLNFGDCFSYALAREKREAILFKGTDFRKRICGYPALHGGLPNTDDIPPRHSTWNV